MFKNHRLVKIAIVSAVTLLSGILCAAQPKSIGVTQSFRGAWISYEHTLEKDCFICLDAGLLLGDLFSGKAATPGYTAGISWNFKFFKAEIPDSGVISLFAGPGLTVGYDSDLKKRRGIIFGVCGRFGVECAFPRNITLSASVNPILGSNLVVLDDSVNMTLYKKGLLYGLIPEIGIKYNF